MLKSELDARLAQEFPYLSQTQIHRAVAVILENIAAGLKEGRRIEFRGFGTFSTSQQSARQGRNPRTGESVSVPAKTKVSFRAGKKLLDRLNRV